MTDPVTLLPSSAARLAKAMDRALARRLAEIPNPIRDVHDADRIDIDLLPWLAWERGLRTWNTDWPEAVRRALVRNAIQTARHMGSVQSLHDVVAAFGGALSIREGWELDPPQPYRFSIVLTLNGQTGETASARYVEEVIAEVRRVKPARAVFDFTQGLSFAGSIQVVGAVRPTVIRRMEFEQAA